jgi:hypothetical protein
MFRLIRKIKRRIKRVLKVQSESRQIPRISTQSRVRKVAMLAMTALLIGTLYPGEDLFDPLDMMRAGEIALEDVIAPVSITVYKTESELEDEREVVRLTVPLVLDCDTLVAVQVDARLDDFVAMVDSIGTLDSAVRAASRAELSQLLSDRFPLLTKGAVRQTLAPSTQPIRPLVLKNIYHDRIYRVGLLPDKNSMSTMLNRNVLLRKGERENIFARDRVMTVAKANIQLLSSLNGFLTSDSIDVEYYYSVGRTFLQPNLVVNRTESRKRLSEELEAIDGVKEIVAAGDLIIRSGSRVNARQERILQQMAQLMRSDATRTGWGRALAPAAARVLIVLAVLGVLYLFLYMYRREIYFSNPKLLTIFLTFGMQLFLVSMIDQWSVSYYLLPVVLLPIVITILFDAEVGIISTLVLSLLLGMLHRFDFGLSLMVMTVGTVGCFASRKVRHRSDFFKIALSLAVAYAAFILLVEALKFTSPDDIPAEVGYGLLNAGVSTLLAIGVLPLFESLFGITTDITLLELSDMNHPLLKRLAIEAPGTYQHAMVVGNLCEAAAKEIGSNSLLARVGAYYHDIGKIEIPEYFVENQLSVKSKHEELSPSMSSLILTSHVKRGRYLGEEFDIPDDVLNFIEEHHGTMRMSYFYNKALESGVTPEEADKLRYPGPKPQIRETGIAMLADAVEAASRTLEDPKPARINNLIQRIINDRFQSGELDECPLTLRDLAGIKKAFSSVLVASFHHRVVYPTRDKEEAGGK